MAANSAVSIQHVSKDYRLGKTVIAALRDVSIDVEGGDFTVIAGPSGSGKTTLLNIIGLIDEPSSGKVVMAGEYLSSQKQNRLFRYRRDRLGYIFQNFNLIPVLSVFENVEYPLILNKVQKKERKERVDRILDRVGLLDRKKHRPSELSGGQRQRVSIARAVVKNPGIVLADEPTANLDSETGSEILTLMERLNQDEGITFIFSSHDPMIIERAGRVVQLRDGKVDEADA